MADQLIPREEITRLEITSVSGNLHLTGWSRQDIRIEDAGGEFQVKEKKGSLQVGSTADLFIHMPHDLMVVVSKVSGDATLRGIASDLQLDSVSGDLSLLDVRSTMVKALSGDLIATRVQGTLRGEMVSGDTLIEDVQGQVELKQVSGDIVLEKVDSGFDVQASGDGRIDFHPVPWQAYRVEVGGDLSITMPLDTNADLTITSGEADIKLFPGKLDIISKAKEFSHQLGEGGTAVQLSAGGSVIILDNEFTIFTGIKMNLEELGDITAGFSTSTAEQIKSSLGNLEEELRESLSGLSESLEDIGISEEHLRELGVKIEESSRRAAEKAEIAALKAQAKAEKMIAKARRKAYKAQDKAKQFDINEFLEMKAQKDSVSDQERMLILKMLQEKKISPQEADSLLKALEGK